MNQSDKIFELDAICSRFESAWAKADGPPELGAFLSEVDEEQQGDLFKLLLPIDVEHRRQGSLTCSAGFYRERFLQYVGIVDEVMSPGETVSLDRDSSVRDDADFSGEMPQTVKQAEPSRPREVSRRSERQRIGRYTVLQRLGGGGQADVYRAAHPTLPIEVAIKVSRQRLSESLRQAMLDEAHLLCDLDHPNIAKIRDLDFDEHGCPILVLELVRGRSLHRLLQDRGTSVERAVGWLADAADAVGYAHRRGVLHLDLKPGNIVIDENDSAKVIDFGLARMRDAWSDTSTESDGIDGTPEYMAPEQARGVAEKITARSDIFALGAILYRILTGTAPFHANSPERSVLRSQRYDFDLELLDGAAAPLSLVDACRRAMARDPSDRFETAEEFARAIAPHVTPANGEPEPASHPKSAAFSIWLLGVSITLAVTLAVLAMVSNLPFRSPKEVASRADVSDTSSSPAVSQELPLEGDIKLSVIRDGKAIPIEHPGARPLRQEDGLRIEANLNQPAYFYLIWIDEYGQAQPFYPGEPGNWQALTTVGKPVQSIVLPNTSEGYALQGQPGMQTILLLARTTPIPSGEDLSDLFAGLPYQTLQDERALVGCLGLESMQRHWRKARTLLRFLEECSARSIPTTPQV